MAAQTPSGREFTLSDTVGYVRAVEQLIISDPADPATAEANRPATIRMASIRRTTFTVDLQGVDEGNDVQLTLEEDGQRALFFSDWKVAEGGLASEATVTVPEPTASGASVTRTR